MTKKEFYSVQELAKLLNKSRQQVNLDIRLGKINGFKVGNSWIIPAKEVNRLTEGKQSN